MRLFLVVISILISSLCWSQNNGSINETIISSETQIMIEGNTTILINEIFKAYNKNRYPIFPSGVLSSKGYEILNNLWKTSPFYIEQANRKITIDILSGRVIVNGLYYKDAMFNKKLLYLEFNNEGNIENIRIKSLNDIPIIKIIDSKTFQKIAPHHSASYIFRNIYDLRSTQNSINNKRLRNKRFTLNVHLGGSTLIETKGVGFYSGVSIEYKTSNTIGLYSGATLNIAKLEISDDIGVKNRTKSFINIPVGVNFHIKDYLELKTFLSGSFGDLTDIGGGVLGSFEFIKNISIEIGTQIFSTGTYYIHGGLCINIIKIKK